MLPHVINHLAEYISQVVSRGHHNVCISTHLTFPLYSDRHTLSPTIELNLFGTQAKFGMCVIPSIPVYNSTYNLIIFNIHIYTYIIYIMLCFVMFCFVMFYYIILYYIIIFYYIILY